MTVARLAAALVAATLVAGCGGRKRTAAVERDAAVDASGPIIHQLGAPPPSTPSFDEPRPPMPQPPKTTLLEPGAAPRAVSRYALVAVAERTTTVRAELTVHGFRDGAWYGPTALPAITDGFSVSVDAGPTVVARALDVVVASSTDAAATAAATANTARWRALLERRRVAIGTDDRGQLATVRFLDDPDRGRADDELATDELAARWQALAVPLPAEPIGVGARWRTVTRVRLGGAYFKQTGTYRLAARTGDQLSIEVEHVRLAEPQVLTVPGLPAGASAELLGIVRTARGTVDVTLASPLPARGTLAVTQSTHARFTLGPGAPIDEVSDDTAVLTIGP